MKLLKEELHPDCVILYPSRNCSFQQNGVPSHTSKAIQSDLDEATPGFIKKEDRPPQSSDYNPMGHSVWDSLKKRFNLGEEKSLQKTN